MEKYYKVSFRAQLVRFALAFKADSQIDVFWKKGEKIAQSEKVQFTQAKAEFNQTLTINCNMVYDGQTKAFRPKITKFEIILYTEKGNKKVGEIHFDVSPYLNERNKQPKEYDLTLEKCPDKNAKLTFKLSAAIEQEISPDAISNSSQNTVNVETLVGGQPVSQITKSVIAPPPPPKDMSQPPKPPQVQQAQQIQPSLSSKPAIQPPRGDATNLANLQAQNRRMKQQLKGKDKLLKQNEQLKRKIKNEQYELIKQIKQKIEAGRKELERLQTNMKKQVLLEKQVKNIEEEIFKCKYQIMSAFNYANERGGGKLMFQMQEACGLKQI